jgi:hypothetical protein
MKPLDDEFVKHATEEETEQETDNNTKPTQI